MGKGRFNFTGFDPAGKFTAAEKKKIEDAAFYQFVIAKIADEIWNRRKRAWNDVVR